MYRKPSTVGYLYSMDLIDGSRLDSGSTKEEDERRGVNSGHCIFRWLALCWTDVVLGALSEGLSGPRLSRSHSGLAKKLYDDVLLVMTQIERQLTENLVTRAVFEEWKYGRGKVDFLSHVATCLADTSFETEKDLGRLRGAFISVPEIPELGLVSKFGFQIPKVKGNIEVYIRGKYFRESYKNLIRALRPWTTLDARSLLSAARRSPEEVALVSRSLCSEVFLTLCLPKLPLTARRLIASFAFSTCKGQKRRIASWREKHCLSRHGFIRDQASKMILEKEKQGKDRILLECLTANESDLCLACANVCELCSKPTPNPRTIVSCVGRGMWPHHGREMRLCSGCAITIPGESGRDPNWVPYRDADENDRYEYDEEDSIEEHPANHVFCRRCLESDCFQYPDGWEQEALFGDSDDDESDDDDVDGKDGNNKCQLVDRLGFCWICQRLGQHWARCKDCLVNMCTDCHNMTEHSGSPTLPHYHACNRCQDLPDRPEPSFHAMRAVCRQTGYNKYKYEKTLCDTKKRPCDNPDCRALSDGTCELYDEDYEQPEFGWFWRYWKEWQILPFSPPLYDQEGFVFYPNFQFPKIRRLD